jgi:hypothetical protein
MAQVSRSTFTTNLGTLINDNSVEDVTPAEVRSVIDDLADSVPWGDEAVIRNATANLTAGYTATPHSLGNGTGTITPAFANGNLQTLTNNAAFTLAAPSSGSGTMVIELTNASGAGAITLSGFTSVTGSPLTTTNGHLFLLSIARFGSRSWLSVIGSSGNG